MNRREVAEQVVKECHLYFQGKSAHVSVHSNPDKVFAEFIEAALRERDERAARLIQNIDLTEWVRNGGRLRDAFAAAILNEEES